MNKKSIKDVAVKGKRCLVRVDFNVPMKGGVITDDTEVNVYTTDGMLIRGKVKYGKALEGLQRGVYLINGRKVVKK